MGPGLSWDGGDCMRGEYSPRISDKTSHVMRHLVHIATGYLSYHKLFPTKQDVYIYHLALA